MNKIFLVEWSIVFEMEEILRFKDLVWANSKEEAKGILLSEIDKKFNNPDGVIKTIEIVECKPENGIFHLGRY